MSVKLTHMAVDASIYQTVAVYARALGYRPRVFFEKAALYCKEHELNKEWRAVFDVTAERSSRTHDLAKDCARAAAKAEKMPVEPTVVEPEIDLAQLPEEPTVDDILDL